MRVGLIFLLLLAVSLPLCGDDLVLATEPWPPYVVEEDGEWSGIAVEILEAALEPLGHRLVIRGVPWRRALAMAERGAVDGIFPLNRTVERESWLQFPEMDLVTSHGVLFHRIEDDLHPDSLADLAGLRLGVIAGYQYAGDLLNTEDVHFEEVPSNESSFQMLVSGRIDVAPCDHLVGVHLARQLGLENRITYYPRPLDAAPMYVGLSRRRLEEHPKLLEILDAVDRRLGVLKDGERIQEILGGWGATGELAGPVLGAR